MLETQAIGPLYFYPVAPIAGMLVLASCLNRSHYHANRSPSHFDAAMQLPEADRLTLASRLMESLPPEGITVSLDDPELAAELDRRFADNQR